MKNPKKLFFFNERIIPLRKKFPDVYEGKRLWVCGYPGVLNLEIDPGGPVVKESFMRDLDDELVTDIFPLGSGKMAVVSLKAFYVLDTVRGAVLYKNGIKYGHSVIPLSRHVFVLACSRSNAMVSIDIRDGSTRETGIDDCHCVAKKNKVIYVLGRDHLHIFDIKNPGDGLPDLKKRDTIRLPDTGGHHLAFTNDGEGLFISTWNIFVRYDLINSCFEPVKGLWLTRKGKSIDQDHNGHIVYTFAVKDHRRISNICFSNPFYIMRLKDLQLYKAKWDRRDGII